MIPGIDPKIDIAFKKVFGSEGWRELTLSLINAVVDPAPWGRITELELLNPYSEKMVLDDKLSILDIKARDEQGRLFNVEMQMVATASLRQRFLYYWSRLYSQQLAEGDDYTQLRPTISICFVNGDVFPGRAAHHNVFRLLEADGQLCLTDDLLMHVIEIPKFTGSLGELEKPLDFWLYFFKNGVELDADGLPEPLNTREIRQAMEVLKMLAQDDLERELYEGRLKAKRDLQTLETQRRTLETQRRTLETQRRTLETQRRTLETQRMALETALEEWQKRCAEASRERDEARRDVRNALAERIQLCERLLRRSVSSAEDLAGRDVEQLREMAERLERELTHTD
jgi:predicted transposase/invertase (TIGR01784 family)